MNKWLNTLYRTAREANHRLLCEEWGAVCFRRNRPPRYTKGNGKGVENYRSRYSIFEKAWLHLKERVWKHAHQTALTGSLGRRLGDGKRRAFFFCCYILCCLNSFFKIFWNWFEREQKGERETLMCCSPVHAGDQTHHPGTSGWCSNQLSYRPGLNFLT